MKLFYWLLTAPLIVVVVLFAVSNRGTVEIKLWPLPGTVETRLFLVVLVPLFLGFFAGGAVAWFGAGRVRSRARAAERAVRTREIEIEELREKAREAEREATARKTGPSAPSSLPAVRPAPADAQTG